MDLFAAESINGRLWQFAKQSAFMCFLVACALLGASLMLTDWSGMPDGGGSPGARTAATVTGPAR